MSYVELAILSRMNIQDLESTTKGTISICISRMLFGQMKGIWHMRGR